MNMDFVAAMRAATQLTRAGKLEEATRVIQNELLIGRSAPSSEPLHGSLDHEYDETKLIDVTPGAAASGASTGTSEPWSAPAAMRGVAALLKDKLRAFESGALPLRVRQPLQIPDGAQFLDRSFSNAAGTRSYKLFVPSGAPSGRRPLIVMLHGGTQDADDFAAGTRMNDLAEKHGMIVAYPSQCKTANGSLCWNWFQPEHQRRGAGEPSIIAGLTDEIVAEYDIDPSRVFVAGLSAGGAMAVVMAATYPDLFAAIGVHSGLPYGSATDVASAFAAMHGKSVLRRRGVRKSKRAASKTRVPAIVFHGDADRIVHPSNAGKIVEARAKPGDRMERTTEPGGVTLAYTREITRDESGAAVMERWLVHGSGHAWSGGSPDGTYTDRRGPDASREMLRFFLEATNPSPRQ